VASASAGQDLSDRPEQSMMKETQRSRSRSLTQAILRHYREAHPDRTFEGSFDDSTQREEMEILIFDTTED
jgi:hypothetical protein